MKALILAAGFGTRLRPYTEKIHKGLFPVAGRPVLDWVISSLVRAGCSGIILNTHHLHEQIEAFVSEKDHGVSVVTRYEPEILGTGGAIRNVADFMDDQPFFVVNGDILFEMDLAAVYAYHLDRNAWATLVVTDWPGLNSVTVDREGNVTGFLGQDTDSSNECLTFTGIQVLDPRVIQHFPEGRFSSSIDTYKDFIDQGRPIVPFVVPQSDWIDIGTPERYRTAAFQKAASVAFQKAGAGAGKGSIQSEPLTGDGSDRIWYRLTSPDRTLVMADHGIRIDEGAGELDAFVAIGHHLENKCIPVPRIYHHDRFSGLVFLEDLGDRHLQTEVRNLKGAEAVEKIYRRIIDVLLDISILGADGFDTGWAYQTPDYSRDLIIERECGYFVEAFLQNHLHLSVETASMEGEFERIADQALRHAATGLMHRDFQSRNILLVDGAPHIIDFQGARLGPIQYDLASLLIDPYVELSQVVQENLCRYCFDRLVDRKPVLQETFFAGYRYCALTRNLQILGAFGYLSSVKGKNQFRRYIPAALCQLQKNLESFTGDPFPALKAIVRRAIRSVDSNMHA